MKKIKIINLKKALIYTIILAIVIFGGLFIMNKYAHDSFFLLTCFCTGAYFGSKIPGWAMWFATIEKTVNENDIEDD